jgi:acyl-CoA thioesterase-1
MPAIALHFASGGAFFTGIASLVAGMLAVAWGRHRFAPLLGRLFLLLGSFAIAMSATPLPLWAYGIWIASLLSWIVAQTWTTIARQKWRVGARVGFIGCTLIAVVWELSYQLPPRVPAGRWHRLIVVGDSLSAEDFTEGGEPWPKLLKRDHGVDVDNLAFSGAQTASAAKRVATEDFSSALVVLEIGGNDLLGAVSADDFERGLERLLLLVCGHDNSVAMLELPLPPLYNGYGEVQRRLAGRYHVRLIPKRYFASVLVGSAATIDSLHLSAAGHQKMADMIWQIVSPALSDSALRIPHSELPP